MTISSWPYVSPLETVSEECEHLFLELDGSEPKEPKPLSISRLVLLTCPNLGLQVYWFLLQSNGTPYLRSLGIPPFFVSLAWALGPIFGIFVQPIVGQISDELHHPFGRRKPVMMTGTATTIIATVLMAYAPELGATKIANTWQPCAIAMVCLFVVLFAINVYSVGVRALIVDACPPAQQSAAAAWSMRWSVLGSAILAISSFVSSSTLKYQVDAVFAFRTLTWVASSCSAISVGLVCWFVPQSAASPSLQKAETARHIRFFDKYSPYELTRRWRQLPPVTGKVCGVQLFAWCGWFPVLYYMSTIILLAKAEHYNITAHLEAIQEGHPDPETYAKPYQLYASVAFALGTLQATFLLSLLNATTTVLCHDNHPRIWLASQLLATLCLFPTAIIRTSVWALALLSFIGATWAVTIWVPFALINTEISSLPAGTAAIQGLHNMAISVPQVASAVGCAVVLVGLDILGILNSAAWLLTLAAVPVGWSAYLIWRLEGKLK
ncbi:hypothetical protein PpBr36_02067 [Pyricularia pennisetigena]|uniref:hypothetical protein n=1 Tax=Pyricularia pennisetigena TaxID=1578925 RepID=UPI0011507888|nr:hypothetical protein PpBr36_02067 [Pyricularia pennisetigena]TLS27895.1 hypothetical protein PpBr36_02067 [Pyricularia pennisetigena]